MSKSKIEWCEATWNPVYGCTPISAGCKNCYAKEWHNRFKGGDFSVKIRADKLVEPVKKKRPTRYFVGAMTDIFHKDVPCGFLLHIFYVMAACPQHTFLILTKRPERMKEFISSFPILIYEIKKPDGTSGGTQTQKLPLPNVWLGVTAENQEMADQRIPILLDTPAAHRFVSVEPMLGPVDLTFPCQFEHEENEGYGVEALKGLDWVICGGESGRNARPIDPDWVLDLRYQCAEVGTPFFFKQWGGKNKAKSGRLIDGVEVMEYPDGINVEVAE